MAVFGENMTTASLRTQLAAAMLLKLQILAAATINDTSGSVFEGLRCRKVYLPVINLRGVLGRVVNVKGMREGRDCGACT